jgi:hypothetical protein
MLLASTNTLMEEMEIQKAFQSLQRIRKQYSVPYFSDDDMSTDSNSSSNQSSTESSTSEE